jgi:CheY-like chemotaxis protein
LAGLLHDLNNMLAVLLAAAGAIAARAEAGALLLDDDSRADLADIVAAAARGKAMLLAATAPSRPRGARAPVSLNAAVAGLRNVLRHAAGGVEVRLEPGEVEPWAAIDPAMLERMLVNLVINARDAMAPGGTVTLRGHVASWEAPPRHAGTAPPPGRYAAIAVHDTGPAIPPEVVARMGEAYFTTKPAGQGTGLGLATVRDGLAAAGGFLTIASTPGEGTCISIHLPLHPPPPDTADMGGQHAAEEKILLVEDDPMLRRLVARALGARGFGVVELASAEAAMAWLDAAGPAHAMALVTDLALPGMTGAALARAVRSRPGGAALPIILVSGFAAEAPSKSDSGIVFLAKPYEIKDLVALIELSGRSRASATK